MDRYGQCSTLPSHDNHVHDFTVDGTGLAPWPIGNQGLVIVQGSQTGASDILIERGVVRNCPPGEGGVEDYEHHAAITVKKADGPVTIRNVEVYGCLAAFYFKYNGPGAVLLEDIYVHDVARGNRFRALDVTIRNSVIVGAGPQFQEPFEAATLLVEQTTLVNSPIGWPIHATLRNSVVLGSAGSGYADENNCYLTGSVYDHFADPDNGDFTLIGQAAIDCAGKGAQ